LRTKITLYKPEEMYLTKILSDIG